MSQKDQCCICGRMLPNRWAVAGRCKASGCDMPFCRLHWHAGNKRCREHGWRRVDGAGLHASGDPQMEISNFEHNAREIDMNEEREDMDLSEVSEKQGKRAMDAALKGMKAAGVGMAGLVAKIQYARSPQAMKDALDENLKKNGLRREEVSEKLEAVHNRIVILKKQYATAPPARKRTLQMELKVLMGEYKNLESEFKILLENETVLGKVRGRFMETLAYDLRGIKEKQIDKITDRIEDRVDDAEGVMDAVADLEGAG